MQPHIDHAFSFHPIGSPIIGGACHSAINTRTPPPLVAYSPLLSTSTWSCRPAGHSDDAPWLLRHGSSFAPTPPPRCRCDGSRAGGRRAAAAGALAQGRRVADHPRRRRLGEAWDLQPVPGCHPGICSYVLHRAHNIITTILSDTIKSFANWCLI